tara:strand:+ start:66 stop:977 length:912 start_codon:yes stop_codon:yes gene_type:complete
MSKDKPPSQAEKLKSAEQKAMLTLAAFNNEAIAEQITIVIQRRIPSMQGVTDPVRFAELKLRNALRRGAHTAQQLEELTKELRTAMNDFKEKAKELKGDDWKILERADLQLNEWKTWAVDEQLKIILQQKVPVNSELYDDLRYISYNLNVKFKQQEKVPLEIEALTEKLYTLIKRLEVVLEDYDKDHREETKKKRADAIKRAKATLEGYSAMLNQDKLTPTAVERERLPEDDRKRMMALHIEMTQLAIQLSNRISYDNSVVIVEALTNRLEQQVQTASQKVKAIRERKDDQAKLKKMDDYFSA